jgi:hypothetical protein
MFRVKFGVTVCAAAELRGLAPDASSAIKEIAAMMENILRIIFVLLL